MRISALLEQRFISILMENYQLALRDFSVDNDVETVKAALDRFKRLQSRMSNPQEKDINYWRKKDFNDLVLFLDAIENKDSKRKRTKNIKAASSDILTVKKTDNTHLFFPLSKEASCFYGSGTPWCISTRDGQNYFYSYTYQQKLAVCFLIHDNAIFAMVFRPEDFSVVEVQDVNNRNDVKTSQFLSMAGITQEQLHQFTLKNYDVIFGSISGAKEKEDAGKLSQLVYSTKLHIKQILNDDYPTMSGSDIVDELRTIQSIVPKEKQRAFFREHFDDLMAKNAKLAYFYAKYIIGGKFEDGEEAIAAHPRFASLYAIDILKSRFAQGEPAIFSDGDYAYEYLRKVIRDNRLPEYESVIAKDKLLAAEYASRSEVQRKVMLDLGANV